MRAPYSTPGRNTKYENVWRSLVSFVQVRILGQQRPIAQELSLSPITDETLWSRRYDLEIRESIVRDDGTARQLVAMVENSPEVSTAIEIRNNSIWGSHDGDDQGWAIAPTLNDNETPVDPEVYGILRRLQDEVIGGISLKIASERFMSFGDCFCSIGLDKQNRIGRILFLPTFELFRVEDRQGQLLGFEQRRSLSDQSSIHFHPIGMVHWRYRRKTIYGRSLFAESIEDWEALLDALDDLRLAGRAVGVNPNIHEMPCTYDDQMANNYKLQYYQRIGQGVVTDYFIQNGGDIRKLSTVNPDFKGLLDIVNFRRLRIGMKSQVPLYLLGIPWDGGKDIASQPAMAFARSINSDRMVLSDGIRYLCNLELALNNIPRERWNYRIIYPKILVNPFDQQADPEVGESNNIGIEDLDYIRRTPDQELAKSIDILKNGKHEFILS